MERRLAAVLVVLVVLSGCIGVSQPVPSDSTTPTQSVPDAGHPWRGETLTVGVVDRSSSDRDLASLVRNATDYWSEHAAEYAGYKVTLETRPNASNPDVRVVYADDRPRCGDGDADPELGCAPLIDGSEDAPGTVRVEITPGYSDATTARVVTHELGHVLGLDHDDRPRSVMSAKLDATRLPTPNATERALPWDSPDLSVYVSAGTPGHRSQVEHALAYFEQGADGSLDATPRFSMTGDPETADVVVRVETNPVPLTSSSFHETGSVGHVYGVDSDDDGALERYTRTTITVAGVDEDASGWYVAYWLAHAMGLERGEFPPPLVDADRDDRRSDWWDDGSDTRPVGGRTPQNVR